MPFLLDPLLTYVCFHVGSLILLQRIGFSVYEFIDSLDESELEAPVPAVSAATTSTVAKRPSGSITAAGPSCTYTCET